MRKLLPKTANNPRGFTLIELMIVITIMAILAIIAIAIYTGLQARARNAKRQGEVKALADGFEVNKIATALAYPQAIQPAWFPGGVIPSNVAGDIPHYVVLYTDTLACSIQAPTTAQWNYNRTVPAPSGATPVAPCADIPGVLDVVGGTTALSATTPIYTFLVCAMLESEVIGVTTGIPFCIPSSQ